MSDEETQKQPSLVDRLVHWFSNEPQNREELLELIREARERRLLDHQALTMIEGVLQVSEMQVRDIMVPRAQMVMIKNNQSLSEILPIIIQSGHSRFPVIEDNRDKMVGILLAKDLLKFFGQGHDFDLASVLRPTTLVPESKRLDALLKIFRDTHTHLAIVVDEYGDVSGLVTIEDVLEQIVGDIEDEYDAEESGEFIQAAADNEYFVNALTPIDVFNEYFDAAFSDDEFDTIGGLVTHEFEHVPQKNEEITLKDFHFRVESSDKRRLMMLRVSFLDVLS